MTKMMRRLASVAMAVLIMAVLALVDCMTRSQATTRDDVSRAIAAMTQVSTYNLDSTIADNYSVVKTTGRTTDAWRWQGHTTVNIPGNRAVVSMNAFGLATPYQWIEYLVGGWCYYNQTSPGESGAADLWQKTSLAGVDWLFPNVAQVTPLVEILKSTAKASVVGTERLDGLDCAVLEISPTADAASDWVLSQDRGGSGPSWMWWMTGPARSREIYTQAYTGGSARFWIDPDTSRILQVDIVLHFTVKSGNVNPSDVGLAWGGDTTDPHLGFDEIVVDMQGELHFSRYGQTVSIVPPAQALAAPSS